MAGKCCFHSRPGNAVRTRRVDSAAKWCNHVPVLFYQRRVCTDEVADSIEDIGRSRAASARPGASHEPLQICEASMTNSVAALPPALTLPNSALSAMSARYQNWWKTSPSLTHPTKLT